MISLRTLLPLGALLLSLPLGAQNPFLRPSLELGMSSANLRMTQSGSSGPLGGIQGLRAGAGLELSLGPLTYISAGLYYQQLGANNELSRRGSRPLELGAQGLTGTEQLRLQYLSIPVAVGMRLAVPFVGAGVSGELGLSYNSALGGSYSYRAASPSERSATADYDPYRLPEGQRPSLSLKERDLALHLAAKLELGSFFLRLGIEQGLTNIWQDAPRRSSLRTTTSWLSLGYTLF